MVAWSPPTEDRRAVGGSRAEGVEEEVDLGFLDDEGVAEEEVDPAGRGRRRTAAAGGVVDEDWAGEGGLDDEADSEASGAVVELRFSRDRLLGHDEVRDLLSVFIASEREEGLEEKEG